MDQQPTAVRQPGGWGRWRLLVALALLDLLLLGLAQGQAGNRAGLVVQFGDGSVRQTCVDLTGADANGDGSVSGEEVLRAAGFPVISEVSSLGPAVCKVGGDGCDYPQSSCFCQCSLVPGTTCRYWSYSRLQGNQWVFSGMGAGGTVVRPGDVEGWAWGVGTVNQGAQPPVRTFNEVCAAQAATETATATRTRTPETPTLTPGLVFVPQVLHDLPTLTASPNATASATATRSATRAATSPPASGGALVASATATTRPTQGQQSATQPPNPTVAPSVTAQPSPTTDSAEQQEAATPSQEAPTAPPADTPLAAPPAPQEVPTIPLPTATEAIGLPGGEPGEPSYPSAIEPTLPPEAPATPTEAAAAQLLPTATAGRAAPTAATATTGLPSAPSATNGATPTAAQDAQASGGSYGQYIVFIALVALLAGGWVAARRLGGAQREGEE